MVASQRCGCQQKCVVAGSGCKEAMHRFPWCSLRFLRFLLALGLKAEEAEVVEAADVQLAVWLMMGSSSLCQSSHIDVVRLQDALELEASPASVVEGQPMILAENPDTDHEALRVVRGVDRCCPLA